MTILSRWFKHLVVAIERLRFLRMFQFYIHMRILSDSPLVEDCAFLSALFK